MVFILIEFVFLIFEICFWLFFIIKVCLLFRLCKFSKFVFSGVLLNVEKDFGSDVCSWGDLCNMVFKFIWLDVLILLVLIVRIGFVVFREEFWVMWELVIIIFLIFFFLIVVFFWVWIVDVLIVSVDVIVIVSVEILFCFDELKVMCVFLSIIFLF